MRLIAKDIVRGASDAARSYTADSCRTALALLLATAGLLGLAGAARAETVEIPLPGGIHASAEYLPGDPEKPAVLVLHGFMQTHQYLTVFGLVHESHDSGFSVLAPTLSLGIDRRRQSMDCEAVHTHDLSHDVREIGLWVDWLKTRGHDSILLVGHSSGSLKLLAYAEQAPDPAVRGVVATSLIDLGNHPPEQVTAARALQARDPEQLVHFPLGFCRHYTTTPAAFLSYAGWGKARILAALKRLTVPFTVVMGSADRRMDADWPELLQAQGVRVEMIEGANHFFSGEKEFDLYERVIPLLETGGRP